MAGEDEGFHAVDGGGAEVCVYGRGFGGGGGVLEFFLVGVEGEVDDGAFAVFEGGLRGGAVGCCG